MRVVTVLNLKGGVGKTTLVSHLSPHLVELIQRRHGSRARVLVIDADTQCGATITLTGHDPARYGATLATVLGGQHSLPDAVVHLDDPQAGINEVIAAARGGIDLLPSNEWSKVRVERPEDFWALHDLLRDPDATGDAELVVIDCGYGDTDLTELAMVASDQLVAVVTPNALDVHGLNLLLRKIARMTPTFPHVALSGVIVNQVTSYLADEEVLNDLVEQLGSQLWQPFVPHRGSIRRANNQHLPMNAYHPRRPDVVALFRALAAKMLPGPTRSRRHRRNS